MPPEIGKKLVKKKKLREYIKNNDNEDIHEKDLNHLIDTASAYLYAADKYGWDKIICAPDNKLRTIDNISQELWEKIKPLIR